MTEVNGKLLGAGRGPALSRQPDPWGSPQGADVLVHGGSRPHGTRRHGAGGHADKRTCARRHHEKGPHGP